MYVNKEHQDLGQWIALATAIVSAAGSAYSSGLFGGKPHFSPWGFLYDEYPQKIWDAEKTIREATGKPPVKAPRPATTGPSGQVATLEIIPPYFPGNADVVKQIEAGDRRLNEPGGYREQTYQKQLDILDQLTKQARAAFTAPPLSPTPYAGAAVPIVPQVPIFAPQQQPGLPPQFAPQQRVFPTAQPLQISQAGMIDMQSVTPFLLAGAGVFALMLLLDKGKR